MEIKHCKQKEVKTLECIYLTEDNAKEFIENILKEVNDNENIRFKEIKYCNITAFDEGCSIGNVTRGEVNLLIKKPDFYCARVILAAVEQIEKYFGTKVDVSISYRLVNINIL